MGLQRVLMHKHWGWSIECWSICQTDLDGKSLSLVMRDAADSKRLGSAEDCAEDFDVLLARGIPTMWVSTQNWHPSKSWVVRVWLNMSCELRPQPDGLSWRGKSKSWWQSAPNARKQHRGRSLWWQQAYLKVHCKRLEQMSVIMQRKTGCHWIFLLLSRNSTPLWHSGCNLQIAWKWKLLKFTKCSQSLQSQTLPGRLFSRCPVETISLPLPTRPVGLHMVVVEPTSNIFLLFVSLRLLWYFILQ